MDDRSSGLSLICRVRRRLCALPLGHVLETLRPLPLEPMNGAPGFVMGLAMLRGTPVPVVDATRLLGDGESVIQRYVSLTTGGHRVALAVSEVLGVRAVPEDHLSSLPPLMQEAAANIVAAIGRLDTELLLVLSATRLLPDDLCADSAVAPP